MTKLEVIKELSTYDHGFLTKEGVEAIVKPFGFKAKDFLYKEQDRRSEFKGLYVSEGKEGDWWEGAEASQLAAKLCDRLGVKNADMHGIGSRLRVCCDALINHLSKR